MNSNADRSFVATVKTQYGHLHVPRLTYGKKTHAKRFYYEPFAFGDTFDISHYLCTIGNAPSEPLKLFFHCFDDYHYNIHITNRGPYYGHALSNEDKDFIGAFPVEDTSTTFNLIDQKGLITTLEHFDSESPTLRIKTNEGSILSVRGSTRAGSLVCTAKISKQPLDFKLEIIRRGMFTFLI